MTKEITLPASAIKLLVTYEIYEGDAETGQRDSAVIDEIKVVEGDIQELMDYCAYHHYTSLNLGEEIING